MIWLRFHYKFSAYNGVTQWMLLSREPMPRRAARRRADEKVRELAEEYSWSEHFRGIDYSVRSRAPRNIVETRLKNAELRRRDAAREVKLLRAQLRAA